MISYAHLSLEEVLPQIFDGASFSFRDWVIGSGSFRLMTFKTKGISCANCGIQATHFSVEHQEWNNRKLKIPYTGNPHLNMYATNADGSFRLMTQDHIIPLSEGGANTLKNSCTMCTRCNAHKAAKMPSDEFMAVHGGEYSLRAGQSKTSKKILKNTRARLYGSKPYRKECHHVGPEA